MKPKVEYMARFWSEWPIFGAHWDKFLESEDATKIKWLETEASCEIFKRESIEFNGKNFYSDWSFVSGPHYNPNPK